MVFDYAIKIRIYPNKIQREFLAMNFGCCRFVYNKMIDERKEVYRIYKNDKEKLYNHKYKTEKEYKQLYPFLRDADSNALQQARRHLQDAYKKFFTNIKDRIAKRTKRYVGYPRYKTSRDKQAYTTCITNNNIKLDWEHKRLKLPKLKTTIRFRDERVIDAEIRSVTISKNNANRYFASILFKKNIQPETPKRVISEEKVVAFDMSASSFLVSENFKFANPRFYRRSLNKLTRTHRVLSRRKMGSKNREKARVRLSTRYDRIFRQKEDWTHKLTHTLSTSYEAIILEDLNIKGMQKFNRGVSKSITLDFSWEQFTRYLTYKCNRERHHLVFVGRYFPSSKLCSECGYKNDTLELKDRKWECCKCHTPHDRDINASKNLKKEGLRILREEKHVTVIKSFNDTTTVGTTGSHAFGDRVRPFEDSLREEEKPIKATVDELGIPRL